MIISYNKKMSIVVCLDSSTDRPQSLLFNEESLTTKLHSIN